MRSAEGAAGDGGERGGVLGAELFGEGGQEILPAEGLLDRTGKSGLDAFAQIQGLRIRRQRQNRNRGGLSALFRITHERDRREAVHDRHLDVHDDRVVRPGEKHVDRGLAFLGEIHLVAGPGQAQLQQRAQGGRVFNGENSRAHRWRVVPRGTMTMPLGSTK